MAILSVDKLTDYEDGGGCDDEITFMKNPVCKTMQLITAPAPAPGKKYWPCAPDGFIPNSIIRGLINPKSTMNKQDPWKPRSLKKASEDEIAEVSSFYGPEGILFKNLLLDIYFEQYFYSRHYDK